MENKMKAIGKIDELNTTIIGTSQSGKTTLGKQLQEHGYFYLDVANLKELPVSIEEIKQYFNIENYLEATNKQNIVLANIIDLIKVGTKKIIFDDILTYLDSDVKKQVIEKLSENNIRFINITMDVEDVLFTDYLIVVFNKQIALEGKTIDIIKEEKILKRMGLTLPFIVDLSIQLKYYGLVDKIYLENEDLVAELWK